MKHFFLLGLLLASTQCRKGDPVPPTPVPPPATSVAARPPIDAGAVPPPRAGDSRDYRGTIGPHAVFARIATQGDALRGSYFYEGQWDGLDLEGRATGSQIQLTERIGGKVTGSFSGAVDATGELRGVWHPPTGPSTWPFVLTLIAAATNGAPVTVGTRHLHRVVPSSEKTTLTPSGSCAFDFKYPEIFGLASAGAEAALNSKLKPPADETDVTCDFAHSASIEYLVPWNARGLLNVVVASMAETATSPPSIFRGSFLFAVPDGTEVPAERIWSPDASAVLAPLLRRSARRALGDDAGATAFDPDMTQLLDTFVGSLGPTGAWVLESSGVTFLPSGLPMAMAGSMDKGVHVDSVAIAPALAKGSPLRGLWGITP